MATANNADSEFSKVKRHIAIGYKIKAVLSEKKRWKISKYFISKKFNFDVASGPDIVGTHFAWALKDYFGGLSSKWFFLSSGLDIHSEMTTSCSVLFPSKPALPGLP